MCSSSSFVFTLWNLCTQQVVTERNRSIVFIFFLCGEGKYDILIYLWTMNTLARILTPSEQNVNWTCNNRPHRSTHHQWEMNFPLTVQRPNAWNNVRHVDRAPNQPSIFHFWHHRVKSHSKTFAMKSIDWIYNHVWECSFRSKIMGYDLASSAYQLNMISRDWLDFCKKCDANRKFQLEIHKIASMYSPLITYLLSKFSRVLILFFKYSLRPMLLIKNAMMTNKHVDV